MINEKRIYTEVYIILSKIPIKYINKIPKDIKEEIFNKADTNYSYEIDDILPESKAFIMAIIREYFQDDELNKKIDEYINHCEKQENIKVKNEKLSKKTAYDARNIFENENIQNNNNLNENTKLFKYKESFPKKLKNFIFRILHINN